MEIQVDADSYKSDPCRIRVRGDPDVSFASTLKQKVIESISKGKRQFIFYFAQESFADSEVLGAFVASFRKIWEFGGNMVIVTRNPHFMKVLHITGLIRILRVFETEEDAVICFSCPYMSRLDCGLLRKSSGERICERVLTPR